MTIRMESTHKFSMESTHKFSMESTHKFSMESTHKFSKTLFFICLAISMGCLAAGYGIAGLWIGAIITIISGLVWLLARKYPFSWLPHICLSVSVGLTVVGLLTGAVPWLMICGSGFALAAWDLLSLEDALRNISYNEQTRRYENKHLQLLTLAVGLGLMLALVGRTLNFEIPFMESTHNFSMVMLLLAALVIFGFERLWAALKKRDMHIQ